MTLSLLFAVLASGFIYGITPGPGVLAVFGIGAARGKMFKIISRPPATLNHYLESLSYLRYRSHASRLLIFPGLGVQD